MVKVSAAALTTITLLTVTIMPAFGYTIDNCPYKAYHGNYTGSTIGYHDETLPDYSVGQWHRIAYYYCKHCPMVWDIIDQYFGTLLRDVPETPAN